MWSFFLVDNMPEHRVVIQKRRLFAGKALWLLCGCTALVVVGTVIQMRMTWSREQMRGITSEASDAITAARVGAEHVVPDTNPFAPLLDIVTAANNETISE